MNVEIIPAEPGHAEAYFGLFSSGTVCRYMDINPFAGMQDAEDFLKFALLQKENRKSERFSIVFEGSIVGTLCLYSIYWHQKRASLGYAIREEYWNRGITGRAVGKAELIARDQMGLNRLQATVLPGNGASKRLLEKQGFQHEGLLRHYEIWEGKGFVDLDMYAKILGTGH